MVSVNGSKTGEKNVVVIQLSGGNDYLNTVVPYEEGLYYDYRPTVHIEHEDVLPVGNGLGFNPQMSSMKRLWDEGKLAVINGIGYPNPNRSHFRSMDIWHTAEPDDIGTEGWLGRAIKELDPTGDNVLTGVNFGRGLPRALGVRGVPVASVGNLETYGLFPDIEDEFLKKYALDAFAGIETIDVYGPMDPEIRGGIISFNISDIHSHDLGTVLDREGIAIRTGHHCTMPLVRSLGVPATSRASFYIYNTEEDIDSLVDGLHTALRYFSDDIKQS